MSDVPKATVPARPASTVVILRDGADGIEVFMVVRHHQIDAFSGALVFPGGKLEDADGDARLRARCGNAEKCSPEELQFRVAGVREAFEECGILLARKRGQRAVIGAADLKAIEEKWRKKLADDEATIVDLAEAEDLEIATDLMVPFAHWITPTFAPKRFDTWFFLAAAPPGQEARPDGQETVDARWFEPARALQGAEADELLMVFPTIKTLERLARHDSADALLEWAAGRDVKPLEPRVEGGRIVLDDEDA